MSLHKLTAGHGYTYLTRQVAAQDATHRGYDSLGEYYAQRGESPGIWMGRGLVALPDFLDRFPHADLLVARPNTTVVEAQMVALFDAGLHPDAAAIEKQVRAAGGDDRAVVEATRLGWPFKVYDGTTNLRKRLAAAFAEWNQVRGLPGDWPVPEEERARIRTEVAQTMFTERYDRAPADQRELSGFLAQASRQATTAVAGYDLTFSPVKSVSALWALAPVDVAREIERAHHDAVADTIAWLEDYAVFTRSGHRSAQQIEVHGLLAAAFTHRDSRAGDPDLHTHVAISNKVRALDGRWLALDGRPLHKMTVAASERYNTRLEALLVARLGLRFAARPVPEAGRRPVREITGVDARLLSRWSARRRAIEVRRGELAGEFQAQHGRSPTAIEALALAQRATLQTRAGKHAPRSLAEQRATWRAEARRVLGSEGALATMLHAAMHPHPTPMAAVTEQWVQTTARTVLATVAAERATWQECHVRAEAERMARDARVPLSAVDGAVDAVVHEVLSPRRSVRLGVDEPVVEPVELRRRDGTSVYTTVGTELYTSATILAAERQLRETAQRTGGRRVSPAAVELALLESTANGVELNPGQVHLVRELACSGARLAVALAPAGTGKTIAMRVLARAWTSRDTGDGGGTIVGLAPSAAAAAVLRDELAVDSPRVRTRRVAHTDTLAKLLDAIGPFYQQTGWLPEWVREIGSQTVVLIDEASMAGTAELAAAVDFVVDRGASVRLVGDSQQLAAIGAGGVLRDIAHSVGAVTLGQVVRFTNPVCGRAEAAASLALRDGDASALAFYADQGRIHVGDLATAVQQAYQAWKADRDAGRDAILLAPTREIVAELNQRARADRLAAIRRRTGTGPGRERDLADGSRLSAGDSIITRTNARRLPITRTDWVKNGDRFEVLAVRANGALRVRHLATGRRITLPARYAAQSVTLGYASTVHTAQGRTADTCHLVATGEETRQLLYVALTRGKHANHVYLVVALDGDEHSVITRQALLPATALGVLARALARDGAAVSATTAQREATDPVTSLAAAAPRYYDALLTAATHRMGPTRLAAIEAVATAALPGLTDQPAYPTLHGQLALIALQGHDPASALRDAIDERELDTARDTAAVLSWRLDPAGIRGDIPRGGGRVRPLPWLPTIPTSLATDPHWGPYLTALTSWVTDLADRVADQARGWQPANAPRWAAGLIAAEAPSRLVADLTVWRAAVGVDAGELAPAGPPAHLATEVAHQRRLQRRADAVLGNPAGTARRWQALARRLEPRLLEDPFWPQLAARLDAAQRAGIDIAALATRVMTARALPDESPAAALWWRLTQHLAPATLPAADTDTTHLHPAWTRTLTNLLGKPTARHVMADPAWPAVVAAVSDGPAAGWRADELLTAAIATRNDQAHGFPDGLPASELTTALAWRLCLLTDAPPDDAAREPGPPRPSDESPPLPIPRDLHRLGIVDSPADDAWLVSLQPPDNADQPADTAREPNVVEKLEAVLAFDRYAAAPAVAPAEVEWFTTVDAGEPTVAVVPRARLLELNEVALEYYESCYPRSWAPRYLRERLGTDLTDHPGFRVGYAPPGWTHLVDHLRRRGATDDELVTAGLANRSLRTGRLYDVFRDRMILPIQDANGATVAFIARRNPTAADGEAEAPKYLNTRTTAIFTKGEHVYGLAQAADPLAAGATPVRVEGPLDAIAVTLAGRGDFVGAAPLGTSFTDQQAASLAQLARTRCGVIVATDGDRAGRMAAARDYWQLAEQGDAPRHALTPDGLDPAELYETRGSDALYAALRRNVSLADTLVEERMDWYGDRLHWAEGRVAAARSAAQVIAALPVEVWTEHIDRLTSRLDVSTSVVQLAVLDAGHTWIGDPHAIARQCQADQNRAHATAESGSSGEPARQRANAEPPAARRVDHAPWTCEVARRYPQASRPSTPPPNSAPRPAR